MVNPSLFNWNTDLSEERQIEIDRWYNSLSREDKDKVDDIRSEGYEDGYYNGSYLE